SAGPRPARALFFLGAHRPDRVRDRAHFRSHPEWRAHLLGPWSGDLFRANPFRLPTAAAHAGHPSRTTACRVNLPRRFQRLPLLSVDLQPRVARRRTRRATSAFNSAPSKRASEVSHNQTKVTITAESDPQVLL